MKDDPIRRIIRVSLPAEHAFRVFTQGMSGWWPLATHSRAADEERDGVTADGVEVEPRVGGRIWETLSNGDRLSWGEILAWEPPRRLLIAWKPNANPLPPTELEITFTQETGATRVSLEHRGWERLGDAGVKARPGYAEGWPVLFDRLFGAAAGGMAS